MKKFLLVAVMLPAMASASDWVLVERSTSDPVVDISIDQSSIAVKGNAVKVWENWEYGQVQKRGKLSYNSFKVRTTYNCRDRTYSWGPIIYYFNDLKVDSNIIQADAEEAVPDSIGEAILEWVCK